MLLFKGSCVALVTPFDKEGVNVKVLRQLLEFQIEEKTDAILVLGTTGEPSTMTSEEKTVVIDTAIDVVSGRVPVIVGVGGNNTEVAASFAAFAAGRGADGVLAVTPYYNKCTQKGLVTHFTHIADRARVPVMLYNVPARTGVNITPESFESLCGHSMVWAIKEASGNITQIAEMARVGSERDVYVFSGNDDHIIPVLSLGGMGVVSVLANVMPRYTHEMVSALFAGDLQRAAHMQLQINPLVSALFCEVNPIPVKTAMGAMGYDMGTFRLPMCEMEAKNEARLLAQMRSVGILKK